MNYPHLSLFVKRVTHSQSQVGDDGSLIVIVVLVLIGLALTVYDAGAAERVGIYHLVFRAILA